MSVPRDVGWRNLTFPEGELTDKQIADMLRRKKFAQRNDKRRAK